MYHTLYAWEHWGQQARDVPAGQPVLQEGRELVCQAVFQRAGMYLAHPPEVE